MKFLKIISDLSFGRVIILAFIVTGLYYASYFDPGTSIESAITGVESAIGQEEARRAEIAKVMKKEEEMRGSILQLQRNLEVVKGKIPNAFTDTQMQLLINDAATNAGVSVSSLSVNSANARDPSAPPLKIRQSEVKPENLIEEVKFDIVLNGTFDAFLKFLDSLAKEDKVIKIRNFKIVKMSNDVEEEKINFEGAIIGFKQANIIIEQGTQ